MLSILRGLGGLGGAAVFICGGTLSSNLIPQRPELANTTIAIYFAGGGIGLMLSGISLPLLLEAKGPAVWPLAWQAMGVCALLMSLACCWIAYRVSEPGKAAVKVAQAPDVSQESSIAPLRRALVAYLFFGLGYIGYMTFVIAWMRDQGTPTPIVITAWTLLGLATWLAPALWRGPMSRWRGGLPLAATMATLALGAVLPLFHASALLILLSAALFGAGIFSTPSVIQGLVKKGVATHRWGEAMAGFTVVFAAGQVAGPILAGWIADLTGSLTPGLALSVVALIFGTILALTQREVVANKESAHGTR